MESMAATSLTVKWDTPAGERTSYIVTLDDGSGCEVIKTPHQDATSAKFNGLTAGKSYTIRLVTVMSGSAKFRTSKSNRCFYWVRTKPLLDKNPLRQIPFGRVDKTRHISYCFNEGRISIYVIVLRSPIDAPVDSATGLNEYLAI